MKSRRSTFQRNVLLIPLSGLNHQVWAQIEEWVNETQDGFVRRFRADYPMLSEEDIRIVMLIRAGLSNDRIARIFHIVPRSLRMRRCRMKDKMKIDCPSFTKYILALYCDVG